MWIQLYRLNKCVEVLEDVVPICRRRGGQLHVQGVQALAFTLWKQAKFRDAVVLFHEIEDLVGSSSALCENMGHTYSSLGDYDEASKYFKRSLLCLDHEEKLGKKEAEVEELRQRVLEQDSLKRWQVEQVESLRQEIVEARESTLRHGAKCEEQRARLEAVREERRLLREGGPPWDDARRSIERLRDQFHMAVQQARVTIAAT
mmetsp:Transcript_28969/g.90282  ORF Transcript_28969/g.90282 Transcript_28969/m.90282 type:complete len:203 (+) Transcript_28969:202-810(+)